MSRTRPRFPPGRGLSSFLPPRAAYLGAGLRSFGHKNSDMDPPHTTAPDLKDCMVQATIQLLADEGPEALQVRRVSAAAGVSSMAVYSRFGGMAQLVEAVIETGYRQLADAFAVLEPTDDALADACRLGLVYYVTARDKPHLFDLMFGLSTPGGYRQIVRPTRAHGGPAFDDGYRFMIERAERAMRTKRIRRDNPERVAAELWSFVHGFVMLDLAGHFAHLDDPLTDVFGALSTNVCIGLGDEPARAAKSTKDAIGSLRSRIG
jgi:AcrR family transcriptional regulator